MKLFVRYVLLALGGLAWSCQSPIMAQNMAESDSIAVIASTDSLLAQPAPQKLNLFQKVLKYFNESNEPRPDKKFDFGIIGGPHYSSTTKLGLGIVASRTIACDTTRSHNSPTYRSTATHHHGFLLIGVKGNNIFPENKYRIDYDFYLYTFPSDFWGIGYDNGNNNDNKSTTTGSKPSCASTGWPASVTTCTAVSPPDSTG